MFEKHYQKANNAIRASKKQKEALLIKMNAGVKRTFWGVPQKAVFTTAICLIIVFIASFLIPQIPKQALPTGHYKPTESATQKGTGPAGRPEPPTEGFTDPIEPSQNGQTPMPTTPGGNDVFTSGTGKVTDASKNPVKPTNPEQPTKTPNNPPTNPPEPPPTDPPEPPPTEPEPGPEPTDPWEPPTTATEPSTDDPTAAPPPTDPTEPTIPTEPTMPTEPSTEEPAEPAGP